MTTTTDPAFGIQGVDMLGYGAGDYEGSNLGILLDEAVQMGANYVTLGSTTEMDLSIGAIVANSTVTTNFSDMGSAIQQAESRGLNVMLNPQVGDANGVTFSVAGETLSNPAAFFAQYKAYLLQWAALAQQYHVAVLSIGSEMAAATGAQYTAYWDDIIASVRSVYSGKLTYYALEGEVSQIQFWSKLDYVGVDVFPDLTSAANPSVAQLNAAWASTVSDITSSVSSLDMPVLFTATGVASINGAAAGTSTDSQIGQSGTVTNQQLQENWWESFFETWAADKPSWLAGISAWDNDPAAVAGYVYDQQDYSLYGKPAATLIAAWYGARDYPQPLQSSFTGTTASDRIALYGASVQGSNRDATYNTVIAIKAHGEVINGQPATIDILVNGKDMGSQTFSTAQTNLYNGLTYTNDQVFYVSLSGLQQITDLRIVLETANSQCYITSVTIGGTALTEATFYPTDGTAQSQTIGTSANQSAAGYTVIDASPWDSGLSAAHPGSASLPIEIYGNGGSDIVDALGLPTQYTITGIGTGVVTLKEASGLDQNAVLNNISYLEFADGAVLDLSSGIWSVDASAATVVADLGDYQALIAAGNQVGAIALTDAATLSVTPAQIAADGAALAKLSPLYTISIAMGSTSETVAGIAGHGNIAVFSGDASQYSVTPSGDGKSFSIGNGTVTDHLSGITALQFTDYTELVASQTPTVAGGVSSAQIADLYAAVLARTPDVAGLAFYQTYATGNPAIPIVTYAEWFLSSPEYTGNSAHSYGQNAAGDAQFITDTYENLLHRAPEAGAIAFYQTKVIDPIVGSATPGTTAYAQAELLAHAQLLTYFSVSTEFLSDVQITATHPADSQHWLVLI